jgi:hypothetical protein
VGGCDHRDGPAPSRTEPPASTGIVVPPTLVDAGDPIMWQLTADPATRLKMAGRGAFTLWMVAHNAGARATDTRRDSLEYLVNGRPSLTLAMAYGNGLREVRWTALEPGDTVRDGRGSSSDPTFGTSLFPAPGDYELVLKQDGRAAASLLVRIDPD